MSTVSRSLSPSTHLESTQPVLLDDLSPRTKQRQYSFGSSEGADDSICDRGLGLSRSSWASQIRLEREENNRISRPTKGVV